MTFELALGVYLFVGCALAFVKWNFSGHPDHPNIGICILTLLMLVFMWPVIYYWDASEKKR